MKISYSKRLGSLSYAKFEDYMTRLHPGEKTPIKELYVSLGGVLSTDLESGKTEKPQVPEKTETKKKTKKGK